MDRLKQIGATIKAIREANDQSACDFFSKAPVELQEQYYQAYIKVHCSEEKPRFLREYEEARQQT